MHGTAKAGGLSTAEVASFIVSAKPPLSAIRKGVSGIVDTMGVMVAGSVEPAVKTLAASLESEDGARALPLLWERRKLRRSAIALLYGMASHILDFDDVSMLAVCHPSAPVLSSLLAAGMDGRSGRDLCEAFVVGTEVMIRLGMAMKFRHYALGFHATATLGTIGAAAACARFLSLDEKNTANAIAIAASSAGGIRKNFGTDVKSLHVGLAALNGLRAAELAKAGLSGADEPLGGLGFINAFTGAETDEWPLNVRLGEPFVVEDPGFEQKGYPCCYMLHRIVDGTLTVRERHGLALDAVRSVHVDMPAGGTRPLIHPRPRSGLSALFSAPYAVVAALADGRIDLASFTDEQVLRPQIQSRLADIETVEREGVALTGSDLGGAPVTLTFALKSGQGIAYEVIANPGSPAAPLSRSRLRDKWRGCFVHGGAEASGAQAESLFDEAMDQMTEMNDVSDWLSRLRTGILGSAR